MSNQRSSQRARLTRLFEQVFSDEQLIAPEQFMTVNGFSGLLLTLFATAVLIDPPRQLPASAVLFIAGVLLMALVLGAVVRPRLLSRSLVVQGLIIIGLGLTLTVDTIRYAATAPPLTMFHYIPGAIVLAVTYGMLQIAMFGTGPRYTPRVRIFGLILGIALELIAVGFLGARFVRGGPS